MRKIPLRRIGLLAVAGMFATAAPGALAASFGPATASDETVFRRMDGDDETAAWSDLDADGLDNAPNEPNSNTGSGNGTTTEFAATRTSNRDGDGTRGNDGTTNGNTVTNNRDGDDTRGNDGTGRGDGGTRTRNLDGDGTRGNDGTTNGNTITRNRDGDDTRGNDGTSDGDNTVGQDGTGGGNNSRSASNDRSGD